MLTVTASGGCVAVGGVFSLSSLRVCACVWERVHMCSCVCADRQPGLMQGDQEPLLAQHYCWKLSCVITATASIEPLQPALGPHSRGNGCALETLQPALLHK